MDTSKLIKTSINAIIESAKYAPSVHNTQPWLIKTAGDSIIVDLDKRHILKYGDPTGRETIISLGIFTEAISLSAQEKGLVTETISLNGSTSEIRFKGTPNKTSNPSSNYTTLLKNRRSDRSVYKKNEVSYDARKTIAEAGRQEDIKIHLVTDQMFISKLAELTEKGIRLALTNPDFRLELVKYLILPWSKKRRGIAVRSLYLPLILSIAEPLLLRLGIGLQAEAALERKRWQSSSAVVCITSKGDMPEDWFAAGRDYLRVALAIEECGFSQATSAAVVEASTFHEDIELMLNTEHRLQSVIRLGDGVKNRIRSPRVPTESLITT